VSQMGSKDLHNTKTGSASFRTGFRSPDRRQYSEYLLRDVEVISLIIIDGSENRA